MMNSKTHCANSARATSRFPAGGTSGCSARSRRFPLLLRRNEPMTLFNDGGDGAPRETGVEIDSHPAARADVGRAEEVFRVCSDQLFLHAGRRGAPGGESA